MPVYAYRCPACGRSFDKFFRSQAAAAGAVNCPACGEAGAERQLTSFQVHYTTTSQLDRLDPQITKELEWADRHHKRDDPMQRINMDFTPPE
jgi:putative FmdB family regulatory protein